MRRLLIFSLILSACQNSQLDSYYIDGAMKQQEMAWNQGDLDGFLMPYANDITFVGSHTLRSKSDPKAMYQKSYFSKKNPGTLAFENTSFKNLGGNHFLVIGKWKVMAPNDTLSGNYSLIWEKQGKEWRIIVDHSD